MWNSSKDFFDRSRRFLYVDRTFLTGQNKETLLFAVLQDSCDQNILITAAIVESKNFKAEIALLKKSMRI